MKNLVSHSLNATDCRREWQEFDALLKSKSILDERKDILPFFKQRHNLSILICTYFPQIKNPNTFAHEYEIYGDFVADLVVGDSDTQNYLLIEFENGAPDSIFKKKKSKATPEWASRFEGAYSQIVDWLWKLEDMRNTADFENTFGSRRAKFQGLIVIGKDMNLAPQEKDRLRWRIDLTMIDSNAISCISFDELKEDLDHWLTTYYGV
ncbi:MAG: Shedu immune nuclease family protein [Cyanobacteria bacterium P01_G01_bin.19]